MCLQLKLVELYKVYENFKSSKNISSLKYTFTLNLIFNILKVTTNTAIVLIKRQRAFFTEGSQAAEHQAVPGEQREEPDKDPLQRDIASFTHLPDAIQQPGLCVF